MSHATYLPDADVTTLVDQIKQLDRARNDVVLLLIAEHSTVDVQALWTALKDQQVPAAGGVFPGVIYGDQRYETGIVADVLPTVARPSVIKGLDDVNFELDNLPAQDGEIQYTALVLVDGLTKHVALFLDRLFYNLRNKVRYIGGGAGSLSFVQKPCIFDADGIYQDAAVVLWLKTTSSLAVRHGWQHLYGPLIASETQGTLVRRLNNQPAFRVYSQIVKSKTGKTLTKENFFEIAKGFPLGIYHPGLDYIVRDPIAFTDDQSLVCVGEVPHGSMVYVLRGDKKSLVENAQKATTEAIMNTPEGQHTLIVDCISRVLYLENDFDAELSAVQTALPERAPTPYGMLTLGEIATFNTGRVEFFNKTFVVGSLRHAL